MGSTTAKDLGKPLYNRDNIVISSNDDCNDLGKLLPDYNYNDFIIVRNFEKKQIYFRSIASVLIK